MAENLRLLHIENMKLFNTIETFMGKHLKSSTKLQNISLQRFPAHGMPLVEQCITQLAIFFQIDSCNVTFTIDVMYVLMGMDLRSNKA